MVKNKEEVIENLEFQIRDLEIDYLKAQEVLADVLDYVKSSKDERADIVAFENDPEIKRMIKESEANNELQTH